ncbi:MULTISPECIES: hypothetical protein [Vibrio]|uniref:hypothetical protein n=1 Tax=Vibrio TaxID=662 RepID=UPI00084194DE|nr:MULTISPECIES: hypothetical protein [Vibrio]ODM56878.1 hypothetical protein BC455_18635 [Vibrio harveyi]USD58480.1 hypothetical protein J4N44_27695 [Vibrio sp. SCSIO 43155]
MKISFIALLIALFSSKVLSGELPPSTKDLLLDRIAKLERNVIGQQVDYYDIDEVVVSLKSHREYLLFCDHKFASRKCASALEHKKNLEAALQSHLDLQIDISEMWSLKNPLDKPQ